MSSEHEHDTAQDEVKPTSGETKAEAKDAAQADLTDKELKSVVAASNVAMGGPPTKGSVGGTN